MAKLVLFIITKYIMALARKTTTKLDDDIIESVDKPFSILIFLGGIRLALLPLGLSANVFDIIVKSNYTLMAIIVSFTLLAVVNIVHEYLNKRAQKTKSNFDDQLIMLSKRIVKVILFIVVLLVILSIWQVQIGPFLAGLGIGGIAIAFALQNTLGNIFGGVSMILDRSIKVGDIIKLDSGEFGTVYDVGLRATRIKTFDNEILIMPNGKLADSKIHNFVLPDRSIRVTVDFGVQYGADPEFVKKIAVEEVNKVHEVMKEPAPWILFNEMADSALTFTIRFWVDDLSKKFDAHQEAITRIYRRLYKEGIGIPFPQREVWMNDSKKVMSPFDKQFKDTNKKYNVTLNKKEAGKNPEQKDTKKQAKEAKKYSEDRKKENMRRSAEMDE